MKNHSIFLQGDRCLGCTSCIKSCPTGAIRVRHRKATILSERCIDCGKCMQVCPYNAFRPLTDTMDRLSSFRYTVALPESALFGQFHNLKDPNIVLGALLKLGFDDVFEVSAAAELMSRLARQYRVPGVTHAPRITSACPTVLRIICLRFPKLIPHVESLLLPMELAARLAREEAVKKTGLSPEEIGIFAIVPCTAKATAARFPLCLNEPVIDGTLSVSDMYLKLLPLMKEVAADPPSLSRSGSAGFAWGYCGGESSARGEKNYLAVDGIDQVIRILEDIEDERLPDVDFVELSACVQGCMGGCLNVENPFSAKMRLARMASGLPKFVTDPELTPQLLQACRFEREPEFIPALQLDADRGAAMEKLFRIDRLAQSLPGLDCSSCGAPSCRALAEDVILGRASPDDCIFRVREKVDSEGDLGDGYLPAPFRHRETDRRGDDT